MTTPEPLPPVPSPPEHLWRQFRINVIPAVTCIFVLAATVWLWGRNLANPLLVGQAEGPAVDVASLVAGRIVSLRVTEFQHVNEGDVLATVETSSPSVLSNTLAVLRAEMEVMRTSDDMDAGDRTRLAVFRLNWMLQRADLAAAQAQLTYARQSLDQTLLLQAEKIASPDDLQIAQRDFDQLTLQVEQLKLAVDTAEKSWRELDPSSTHPETPAVKAELAVAEQKLRLAEAELKPIEITAPIGGVVTKIDKLVNTVVDKGIPILTIASSKPDRIIGFLGQPLRIEPKVGMRAEIRSRGFVRKTGEAKVLEIGPRMELFDAPLRVRGMTAGQERGLPIRVSVPPDLSIRPGEFVDIRLLPN